MQKSHNFEGNFRGKKIVPVAKLSSTSSSTIKNLPNPYFEVTDSRIGNESWFYTKKVILGTFFDFGPMTHYVPRQFFSKKHLEPFDNILRSLFHQ